MLNTFFLGAHSDKAAPSPMGEMAANMNGICHKSTIFAAYGHGYGVLGDIFPASKAGQKTAPPLDGSADQFDETMKLKTIEPFACAQDMPRGRQDCILI